MLGANTRARVLRHVDGPLSDRGVPTSTWTPGGWLPANVLAVSERQHRDGRWHTVKTTRARLPSGTDVTHRDRIETHGGEVFNVAGVADRTDPWGRSWHVVCQVERVGAGG